MSEEIKSSIIIAVYNRPEVLKLTLTGYNCQTEKDFELIIADDGSKTDIWKMVEEYKTTAQFKIKHIWQEDKGFRKNRILNNAIRESAGDYLVFADFDCIPGSRFVEDHIRYREKGKFLVGRRVELGERISKSLKSEDIINKKLENFGSKWFGMFFSRDTKYFELGVRIPFDFINKMFHPKPVPLLGHNFSIYKEDLIKINGFNEDYDEVGVGEDIDIEYRLINTGIVPKNLLGKAIQYHYYHKVLDRSTKCYKLFEETREKKMYYCKNGLTKK